MRKLAILIVLALAACVAVTPPPAWDPMTDAYEAEYAHYLGVGGAVLNGQAFLTQRGGGVVYAAGRTVTLDPATSVGAEWWSKAGTNYQWRDSMPDSPSFGKARRTTVADGTGRFRFADLPPGWYYVRTDVTWEAPYHGIQGGLVGQLVEVKDGRATEVILHEFASDAPTRPPGGPAQSPREKAPQSAPFAL
jgi:hypothetical protein